MDEAFVVNVEAAVYRDGAYLLAERAASEDHAAGLVSLVGGKVEPSDASNGTLRETARREVREEVGVEVGDLAFVTSGTFEADDGSRVLNTVFLARHESGEPSVRDPEELAAVEWLSPAEVAAHESVPSFTKAYLEQVDERRQALGW